LDLDAVWGSEWGRPVGEEWVYYMGVHVSQREGVFLEGEGGGEALPKLLWDFLFELFADVLSNTALFKF